MIKQHVHQKHLPRPPKLNEHTSLKTFVDDTNVNVFPQNREYLEAMFPYFPRTVVCCGAYLTPAELAWKINWHWEVLLSMAKIALNAGRLKKADVPTVERLVAEVAAVAPSPAVGYLDSGKLGVPADPSPAERVTERHRVITIWKEKFRAILSRTDLRSRPLAFLKDSPRKLHEPKRWWSHAVNTVDAPETSNHGRFYAFDLGADDQDHNTLALRIRIERISVGLGAGFRNDEDTHVHVEFPQGVKG